MCRKMDFGVEVVGSSLEKQYVDILVDIFYAYHIMPPKPIYPKTKPMLKTMTKNPFVVGDRFEEVYDLELHE